MLCRKSVLSAQTKIITIYQAKKLYFYFFASVKRAGYIDFCAPSYFESSFNIKSLIFLCSNKRHCLKSTFNNEKIMDDLYFCFSESMTRHTETCRKLCISRILNFNISETFTDNEFYFVCSIQELIRRYFLIHSRGRGIKTQICIFSNRPLMESFTKSFHSVPFL